jgi:hypothetical protein
MKFLKTPYFWLPFVVLVVGYALLQWSVVVAAAFAVTIVVLAIRRPPKKQPKYPLKGRGGEHVD